MAEPISKVLAGSSGTYAHVFGGFDVSRFDEDERLGVLRAGKARVLPNGNATPVDTRGRSHDHCSL